MVESTDRQLVVVASDHLLLEALRPAIEETFPGILIDRVPTEHMFMQRLPEFQESPPHAFLVSDSLRFTNPAPEMPDAPEEVKEQGPHKAGIRCLRMLAEYEQLRMIPIALWTIWPEDAPIDRFTGERLSHLWLIGKSTLSGDQSKLMSFIRQATGMYT